MTWEAARNAQALEAAAWEALRRQGITRQDTGQFCCPADLALQAEFEAIHHL